MTKKSDSENLSALMADYLRCVAESHDRSAFEKLFRHFAPRVKAYLLRAGGNASTAEDLMQETMVTIWRKAGQYDPSRASASTWVFTIARNLRIDAYRRERHPEIDPDDPALVPDDVPSADMLIQTQQIAESVNAALASLSEAEQTVIRLAYFEHQAQSAISEQLGIPLGTVKSRVRLAYGKLRASLADNVGDTK